MRNTYYAAPELWNDKSYSFKRDICSLGCILYELNFYFFLSTCKIIKWKYS